MYLLRITDGTTTVNLSGETNIIGCTYFPLAGGPTDEQVTETIPIILEGTEVAIRAKINVINRLLSEAGGRPETMSPRVYLEKVETATSVMMRSEILLGEGDMSSTPGRHRLSHATMNTVEYSIIVTRKNFWETSSEQEIALSSSTDAATLGGVTVFNDHNGSAGNNRVGIASNQILGDLPAPIRLRIQNTDGAAVSWQNILISNNVFAAPGVIDYWLRGDTDLALGSAAITWSPSTNFSSLAYIFPLSSTFLAQAKGRYFRVVAAFSGVSSQTTWRAGIYSDLGGVYIPMRLTKEYTNRFGVKMMDLGALPFPPGGYEVNTSNASLVIGVRSTLPGSATILWVQLMPTESHRRLYQTGYSTANNGGVEDDGILGNAYAFLGASRYPIIKPYYQPIHVWPGRTQELTIIYDEGTGFTQGREMTVSAWYRPRFRSV